VIKYFTARHDGQATEPIKHLASSAFTERHFCSSLHRRSSTFDGVPFRRRGRRSTAPQVKNSNIFNNFRAMRWCTCLRYCATSRMTATSIPDGVTETFHFFNPSGRTIAEKPSQPLTKFVQWISPGGSRRAVRKADITTFTCRMSRNSGSLHLIELPRD
jgi:hypothetical protein